MPRTRSQVYKSLFAGNCDGGLYTIGEASPCSTPLGSEDLSDTSERRRSRRDREGSPRRRSATGSQPVTVEALEKYIP